MAFTAGWTDLTGIVAALAGLDPPPAAVAGPRDTVEAVATALGRPITRRTDERLFRLDTLTPPPPTPGSARAADAGDADWLARWYADFAVEAFGRLPPGFDAATVAHRGIDRGRCWLWCIDGDQPVSFAARRPSVRGAARIGPVYTPPQWRGKGYGSAVTAAASGDVLAEGAVACLHTDRANPTSNKIYQALGYVAVADEAVLRFD